MPDEFEYVSRTRLEYRNGYRHAYLGDAEAREATERALTLHPEGCPAHQSVKGAIEVTWDATVRVGGEAVSLRSGD